MIMKTLADQIDEIIREWAARSLPEDVSENLTIEHIDMLSDGIREFLASKEAAQLSVPSVAMDEVAKPLARRHRPLGRIVLSRKLANEAGLTDPEIDIAPFVEIESGVWARQVTENLRVIVHVEGS
jgi:hypothetical protein